MKIQVETTIKQIETAKFNIALLQAKNGKYYITYNTANQELVQTSEALPDLNQAFYLFDIKLRDLEGH